MKISVITVCCNSADTLSRALNSVSSQDYANIEHILIDGGSIDGTMEIVEKFRDKLAIVVSEPDHGIYDAMNKGLERCTGEVICFLNSDDYYVNEKVLSKVIDNFEDKTLDAVYGDVGFFRANNPSKLVRRYRSDKFTPERLAWGWIPAHPTLFLRNTIIQRVGRFKPEYRIAGDFDYIIRAFNKFELNYKYIPEILVYMQLGGASTGSMRSKFLLNREVLRACRENGLRTNLFKLLSRYPEKILEVVSQWRFR